MQNIYIFFHKITAFLFFIFVFYFLAEETIPLPGLCVRFAEVNVYKNNAIYVKKCKNLVQAWHAHRPCLNSPAAFDSSKGRLLLLEVIIFNIVFWCTGAYIGASTFHTRIICSYSAPVFLTAIPASDNKKRVS